MPKRTCSIDGCERPALCRGWCTMHYKRWKRLGDPGEPEPRMYQPERGRPIDRFEQKVDRSPEHGGCWIWTGFLGPEGYGKFYADGLFHQVHRWYYEQIVGPVPDDLDVDHVKARGCRYNNCVNPAHLEPVTHHENILRGDAPTARNARKTECPKGHPYDEVNTRIQQLGGGRGFRARRCRICDRERWAKRHPR